MAGLRKKLEEIGFVWLGWHRVLGLDARNPARHDGVLHHPGTRTVALLRGAQHVQEPPARLTFSTTLEDGREVETLDGEAHLLPLVAARTVLHESRALLVADLYRDHLAFVARAGVPVARAELTLAGVAARNDALAAEAWKLKVESGGLRECSVGSWRLDRWRLLAGLGPVLWYLPATLLLLRRRAKLWRQYR